MVVYDNIVGGYMRTQNHVYAVMKKEHIGYSYVRMAASRRKVSFDDEYMTNLINLSAPAWEGVRDADEWIHDLRGE